MCDCKWEWRANPAADPRRVQADVPFYLESGKPCDECLAEAFRKLYASCTYGRCKRPRTGTTGGCDLHQSEFTAPADWTPPQPPEPVSVSPTSTRKRINPYNRYTKTVKVAEVAEKDDWAGYSKALDDALDAPRGANGLLCKETPQERAARIDRAITRMAHNILHAWD